MIEDQIFEKLTDRILQLNTKEKRYICNDFNIYHNDFFTFYDFLLSSKCLNSKSFTKYFRAIKDFAYTLVLKYDIRHDIPVFNILYKACVPFPNLINPTIDEFDLEHFICFLAVCHSIRLQEICPSRLLDYQYHL